MNILIFRSALLSYSETFIPTQAEQLKSFTPHYAGLIPVPGYPLPPGRILPIATSPKRGKLLDAAAIFGFYSPRFFECVRAVAPALVHAHFEEGGIKALNLAERLRVPLVTTSHGYDVTVSDYRWRRYPGLGAYYQKRRYDLFRRGSLFLGISRFICDLMLQRGFPKEKVQLHYIGVDPALFVPPPQPPAKPLILFVGRLVENKRCTDVIAAMAKVGRSYPDAELVVIGDGLLRASLEVQANTSKVKVRFLGAQPAGLVRKVMAEAMVLCVPSARIASGASEGLGMVFLEASAMGIPIVATKVGGIPEAVSDGETGLLARERSPDELAAAIVTLLADASLRRKMGAAGRQRVIQHFNLQTQTQQLEQMYAALLR